MNISIKILGVTDGDANIITLKKNKKSLVILIDSGIEAFSDKVINEVDKVLQPLKKKAPDLIVCTHFDGDHIGGMCSIIHHYKENTGRVWLHKPVDEPQRALRMESFLQQPAEQNPLLLKHTEQILKSIPQLKSLVSTINGYHIPIEEPFAGETTLTGWPEIKVMGPTRSYFKALFPNGIKSTQSLIQEEAAFNLRCETKTPQTDIGNPCEILDHNPGAKMLTATNKASIIFSIIINKKKYLFTGDAGIESFEKIPEYETAINNLFFLKIPHHASRNNLSCRLISLMKPSYAAVSGEKYVDQEVIGCLENNGSVVKMACNSDVLFGADGNQILFE